jgi:hypothetical protein
MIICTQVDRKLRYLNTLLGTQCAYSLFSNIETSAQCDDVHENT